MNLFEGTSEYASSLHKLPGIMSGTYEPDGLILMLYVYGTHYVFTSSDLIAFLPLGKIQMVNIISCLVEFISTLSILGRPIF